MSKIIIDLAAIHRIKEFALQEFHDNRAFKEIDAGTMQAYLLFKGLAAYISMLEQEPQFSVEVKGLK